MSVGLKVHWGAIHVQFFVAKHHLDFLFDFDFDSDSDLAPDQLPLM